MWFLGNFLGDIGREDDRNCKDHYTPVELLPAMASGVLGDSALIDLQKDRKVC